MEFVSIITTKMTLIGSELQFIFKGHFKNIICVLVCIS